MLTVTKAKAAKPSTTVYEMQDGDGLALRVTPGGVKSWTLRYRNAQGDRRRITLGRFGDKADELTVKQARKEARRIRGDIARGQDPAETKKAARSALRMRDLFGRTDPEELTRDAQPGWYLDEYVKTAGRNGTAKAPKSIETDRLYVRKHLRSRKALMRKPCAEVTKRDLERVKADCSPGAWRKVRAILRIGFRHAQEMGQIPAGPTVADKTTQTRDKRCERFLTAEERAQLEDVLEDALARGQHNAGGMAPGYVRAFRLLAMTGMRLGEVLDLRWEHIDFRHGQAQLPTSKTGAKSVPLTPQAIAYLRGERGKVGRIGRVCGSANGDRLSNVQRAWIRVRKRAGLEDVRIHDLRHSWASDALAAGIPLATIGKVLGHKSTATTARYAHLADAALRDALKTVGAAIEAASSGEG